MIYILNEFDRELTLSYNNNSSLEGTPSGALVMLILCVIVLYYFFLKNQKISVTLFKCPVSRNMSLMDSLNRGIWNQELGVFWRDKLHIKNSPKLKTLLYG